MKKRLKTVFTILFALIFSIFFPSFGLCGNEGILVQNPGLDIRAEVEYTDDSDHGILHHSFMCMEGQKGLFWAQNFEQPKNRSADSLLNFLAFLYCFHVYF